MKNKTHKKCATPFCRNNKAKDRTVCNTCASKKYRNANDINKMRVAYKNLKANSKRRGKYFDLTFEQFREFCYKTDYIRGAGKKSESYSIDRIENEKGYTIDNIVCIQKGENSRKGRKVLHFDYQYPEHAFVSNANYHIDIKYHSQEGDIF